MGKAQSKRSVDITTDTKKDGIIEEGTGEMKKIEDVDQLKPQVNGDTYHNDNEEKDKIVEATGESENEKDLSTEKEQPTTIDAKAQVEGAGDAATITQPALISENGDELLNESKSSAAGAPTDTSTPTDESPDSSKKPKKEKVKKKWSFRSISFGKKDKQKPAKKDDANTSAVNGECEKVLEETIEEPTVEKQHDTTIAVTTTATELSSETPAGAEAVASTTSEVPKEQTVITAIAGTDEESTKVSGSTDDNIAAEISNDTITPDTKVEEITKSLDTVKINEKIEESDEKTEEAEMISTPQTASVVEDIITTNGDNHNDDIISDINDTATVEGTIDNKSVIESPVKLNGSSESPKIEVKEDIYTATTQNILLSNQDNLKNIKAVIVNNSCINENIIVEQNDNKQPLPFPTSSPPPPLPCSLPPSQVMVFALSDINNQTTTSDQKQEEARKAIDMSQKQQLKGDKTMEEDSVNIVYEKLSTTIEECLPTPEKILPEEILNKIENMKQMECELPLTPEQFAEKLPETENKIEEENLKTLETHLTNKIEQVEIEIEQQIAEISDDLLIKNELIISKSDDIPMSKLSNDELNNPVEVPTGMQQIEIEDHSVQKIEIESSNNDLIIPEINEISTSQQEATVRPETIANKNGENNDQPSSSSITSITDLSLLQMTNEIIDNDLPTPPPSPIQEMFIEKISSTNVVTEIPTITNTVEIASSLDLDKMTGSDEILLITAEQGVQVNDGDVALKQNKQKQQHKKNKNNGVDENHLETTATESLNGVEHKTIEVIKAENQQIEKIGTIEVVTQESATVTE